MFRGLKIASLVGLSLLLLATMANNPAQATPVSSPLGTDVIVGSFQLHVQIERQRVAVQERGGTHAAQVPATHLIAAFEQWDPLTQTVSISIGIENTGTATLFGPLEARLVKIASPFVTPINPDDGGGPGSWRFTYSGSSLGGATYLSPAGQSAGRVWQFSSPTAMSFKVDVEIVAGVPLAPNQGGTIEGPGGTKITVAPDAIPYEVLIDIEPLSSSGVSAPLGQLPFAGAVKVTYRPVAFNAGLEPPSVPLQISIPDAETVPTGQFIVAQQVLIDAISGPSPGLRDQLIPVDTAYLLVDELVTEGGGLFSGVLGGGIYVFLGNLGSGFATGVVSDGTGPRPGAVVSNNTNTLVAVTDGAGSYTLYINGGPFTVTAFDPFRGTGGSASGTIATSGSTVQANVGLAPLPSPPNTRDGIRNGGFERGDLSSWATNGATLARQQLGPTSAGVVIRPTEGQWMADINTGPGSVGSVGSSLKQRFIVPAGVRTLRLDFNFISEEFPEFVGTIFNDAFSARITTPNGQSTFAAVSVNNSGGFSLIGNCFFPGGDSTCGQTGWRQGSVDLSAFAGTNTPISVELLFSAIDAGDNIYDTHVLVDNLRFSTLWVDANLIAGGAANRARVEQEIRTANEILSQAGLNVRLRDVQSVADPGGLLDLDDTWTTECRPFLLCLIGLGTTKGVPTMEETTLLGLSRSATATDLNAYYVRSLSSGAIGFAVGPDDFHDINILTNSGVIMPETASPESFAHEIGHMLISPERAGSNLEHSVGVATNLMNVPRTVVRNVLNRQQSANINRQGAPLLRP